MKSPLVGGYALVEVEEVDSTQTYAANLLRKDEPVGAVLAHHQSSGVGRFGRPWVSRKGESLTMTMIFRQYPSHPRPYLIGMSVAVAVASALHTMLQWPNDVVIAGRKVAGILTTLSNDSEGKAIALVGVGVNLNQRSFPPELEHRATSLFLERGGDYDAVLLAEQIIDRLGTLPEPESWSDLAPIWALFDATPQKRYELPSGEEGIAIGVGSEGQLLCTVAGEPRAVLAADALFGG